MSTARDARANRLLDPRWNWLTDARTALYRELEPGMTVRSLALFAEAEDGTLISYSLTRGSTEVGRGIITDHSGLSSAVEQFIIDAAPEMSP